MNEIRPLIKIKPSPVDVVVDLLSFAGLILLWVYTAVNYVKLPDTIPTHFNLRGEIDGFGGRATILILPSILLVVHVGLTILNRYPHIFNYPAKITEENAREQYTLGTRLIRYVKLVIVIIFFFIIVSIIKSAHDGNFSLEAWFVPVASIAMFIPVIIFFYQSNTTSKK